MSVKKTVFAPAKVNLCLHVLGKRTDGYHELAMLMQRVDLFDRLDIELIAGRDISVSCPGLELADGEQNIVERAARLFLAHVGISQGISIAMEKHIPAAAGLGGGSSDAAAVLEALDDLLGTGLSRTELIVLGRDVWVRTCLSSSTSRRPGQPGPVASLKPGRDYRRSGWFWSTRGLPFQRLGFLKIWG